MADATKLSNWNLNLEGDLFFNIKLKRLRQPKFSSETQNNHYLQISTDETKQSYWSRRRRDLKSCHLTASDECSLLRKLHFLPKSGFQVTAFSIQLELRYLIIIAVKFVSKWERQPFFEHYRIIFSQQFLIQL